MMVSGANTVRAYMTPTSSKRAWVGSKPDSSASTPNTSEPPCLGVLELTPLRPGPLVVAPARSSSPTPSAPAPATPAAAAAPPNSTWRRSNLETIGPPFHRTQRTPRRFPGDVSAQEALRGGGTVASVSGDWDLPGFSAWLGGRAAATRKAYLSDLTAFADWMSRSDVHGPEGVDRMHLRRYLASLGTRRLARATIARKAAALRCFFSWQVRQGHLPFDPARALRAPSGGGRLPRVLSPGEMTSLLKI